MEMEPFNYNPALYQLIGPIETLYQLVPIGGGGSGVRSSSRFRTAFSQLQQRQQQQLLNGEDGGVGNNHLFLVPIPLPYLDNGEDGDEENEEDDEQHADDGDDENGLAGTFAAQLQLVGPIGGGGQLVLIDEELYQLAPPNELDAPIQLLAIEGPPQYPIVGPVPVLARIRCRFANETPRLVDLVWTDDNNRMYRYAKLANQEFVDITTFEGHQWIFCDALDGQLYLINPGRVRKFVATEAVPRGHRLRVSAIQSVSELTLKTVCLRLLAQNLFDVWNAAASQNHGGAPLPPMSLLLQSMRLPLFIQIQVAQFVLSCIVYQQRLIESSSNNNQRHPQMSRVQKQIFSWLIQFVRANVRGTR